MIKHGILALALAGALTASHAYAENDLPVLSPSEVITPAAPEVANGMRFGYTTMDLLNPYFIEVARGMEDRAKELGIELTVHDGKSDAAAQISAAENFIANKMDAIILAPIAPEAMEPLVDQAHAAGISVINSPQRISNADAWYSVAEYEYGRSIGDLAGKYITEKLGGEASVAVLTFPEVPTLIARGDGIKDGLAEFAPNAKIVAEQSALTPDRGATAAETILQAHPEARVFVGVNDAGILGAYEVIKGQGMPEEEFALFGLDATAEAVKHIKEGGMYKATVDITPYKVGQNTIDLAVNVIKNGPIKGLIKFDMSAITQD